MTTSSRSAVRSTVVGLVAGGDSLSLLARIGLLPPDEFLNDHVQLVEARGPELAIPCDCKKGVVTRVTSLPAAPRTTVAAQLSSLDLVQRECDGLALDFHRTAGNAPTRVGLQASSNSHTSVMGMRLGAKAPGKLYHAVNVSSQDATLGFTEEVLCAHPALLPSTVAGA